MFVALLFRSHKETSKLREYFWTFFSQLRLSLACHCAVAHYWCSYDISLWDYTLWEQWCHRWHSDPSATFCTHTKVISHLLLYLRPEPSQPFHFFDVIVAFLSRGRRPVCMSWPCLVLTTHSHPLNFLASLKLY